MALEQLMTSAKQILCALFALILPFMGIGRPALGAKAPAPETVRIMSFNVRDGEYDRGEIVPQVVADYLPDSVGFQECEGTWYLTLRTYLPDYGIVGVGRLTGAPLLGESTAIMYRNDKYRLIDWGTFWLSETPDRVSIGWDAKYHRTCTWAILENKETGARYAHVNTHLDNAGSEARVKGLELVIEKAESFDMPVVITGDFNFPKGSDLYNTLVASSLTDSAEIAVSADSGCTAHGYKDVTEGNPIDFVCVNDRITDVRSYNIVREKYNDRFVSDHYPIFADMVF
ncbi:MAG: endonuclease/exonuclease/phosphatase family protein [Ruminococcaceae bacterium]|nr:endonuclease/exonuclease/phosphatase family protein [Oscillospiraceae bacterium]